MWCGGCEASRITSFKIIFNPEENTSAEYYSSRIYNDNNNHHIKHLKQRQKENSGTVANCSYYSYDISENMLYVLVYVRQKSRACTVNNKAKHYKEYFVAL